VVSEQYLSIRINEVLQSSLPKNARQSRFLGDRAVMVAKKALQVAEQEVGPNHPDVATSLNNLASLYRIQLRAASSSRMTCRA